MISVPGFIPNTFMNHSDDDDNDCDNDDDNGNNNDNDDNDDNDDNNDNNDNDDDGDDNDDVDPRDRKLLQQSFPPKNLFFRAGKQIIGNRTLPVNGGRVAKWS